MAARLELCSPNVAVVFFLEAFPGVLLLQSTEKFYLTCLSYISNVIHIVINVLKIKCILNFLNELLLKSTTYFADPYQMEYIFWQEHPSHFLLNLSPVSESSCLYAKYWLHTTPRQKQNIYLPVSSKLDEVLKHGIVYKWTDFSTQLKSACQTKQNHLVTIRQFHFEIALGTK